MVCVDLMSVGGDKLLPSKIIFFLSQEAFCNHSRIFWNFSPNSDLKDDDVLRNSCLKYFWDSAPERLFSGKINRSRPFYREWIEITLTFSVNTYFLEKNSNRSNSRARKRRWSSSPRESWKFLSLVPLVSREEKFHEKPLEPGFTTQKLYM